MAAPAPAPDSGDALRTPARGVLLRSAAVIALATIVSRILGLGRETTITSLFPTGVVTDAFYMAYSIPDLVRVLVLSGILSAIYIPLYAEVAAQQGVERAKKMAGQFLSLTVLVGLACTLLGILFAPQIIGLTSLISPPSPDQDPQLMPLAIELTRYLFPMLLFTGLSGLLQSVFNSLHDYRTPAWAPLWFNLVFIVIMLTLHWLFPDWKTPQTMCVATVLGMVCQVAVQLPALRRHGISFARPELGDPHWRKFAGLVPAAFIGYAALVTNSFVDRAFAFGLGDVVTTAQYLSLRLQQLPNGIIAVTLVTALFPTIAQKLSLGEREGAAEDLYLAIRLSATALLPATLFLIIWAAPIVRLLFNHGEFAKVPEALPLTAQGVMTYALAMYPLGAGMFVTRTFFAINDSRTPVIFGLTAIVLNYCCDYLLATILGWGLMGIALSSTIVSSYIFLGGLWVLRGQFPEMRRWLMRPETGKVLLLAVLYGAVMWGIARGCEVVLPILRGTETQTPIMADLLYLAGMMGVSLAVLAGGAVLLKMEEVQALRRVMRKRSMPVEG